MKNVILGILGADDFLTCTLSELQVQSYKKNSGFCSQLRLASATIMAFKYFLIRHWIQLHVLFSWFDWSCFMSRVSVTLAISYQRYTCPMPVIHLRVETKDWFWPASVSAASTYSMPRSDLRLHCKIIRRAESSRRASCLLQRSKVNSEGRWRPKLPKQK